MDTYRIHPHHFLAVYFKMFFVNDERLPALNYVIVLLLLLSSSHNFNYWLHNEQALYTPQ